MASECEQPVRISGDVGLGLSRDLLPTWPAADSGHPPQCRASQLPPPAPAVRVGACASRLCRDAHTTRAVSVPTASPSTTPASTSSW